MELAQLRDVQGKLGGLGRAVAREGARSYCLLCRKVQKRCTAAEIEEPRTEREGVDDLGAGRAESNKNEAGAKGNNALYSGEKAGKAGAKQYRAHKGKEGHYRTRVPGNVRKREGRVR